METIKSKWKILCNDELWHDRNVLNVLNEIAVIDYQKADYHILKETINKYDAYFASAHISTDKSILERAKKLRIIATPSTGTDHIDIDYAKSHNIKVLDLSREYELLDNFSATAEHAWCLCLSLLRKLPQAFESAKAGEWARQIYSGIQLQGKTIGIIGYGRLGKMMVEIAKGFRMNILACDIKPIDNVLLKQVELNELLKESDIVSLHVHLNENTKGMISTNEFALMKPGSIIINTSRGAIIDEDALLNALKTGMIHGAGLDVINGEWNDRIQEHPLIEYARSNENLIITPHIGGSTIESIVGARAYMAQKLKKELISLTADSQTLEN